VKLRKISMVKPNKSFISAPSRLRTDPREVSQEELLANYGAKDILVSFNPDGVSDPLLVTAYNNGYGWWIVARGEDNPL